MNSADRIRLIDEMMDELTITKSKYKFSRNWYIAEFRWQDQRRVFQWCEEQFGQHPGSPDAWSRWKTMPQNAIAFRDEKDYAWFVLRWS